MIFMAVGQHQAEQTVAALFDELNIGDDDVDAGHHVVAEGDAEVDHDPVMIVRRPVTIEIDVHPNLLGAAEGDEQKLRRASTHEGRFRR